VKEEPLEGERPRLDECGYVVAYVDDIGANVELDTGFVRVA
jgi:hypothetical protein